MHYVPQLFQPPGNILVCVVLGDVVYEQRAHGSTIVGRCNRTVTLLARGVPDLRLDGLVIHLNAPSSELDTDRGLRIEVELVAGESREEVGFASMPSAECLTELFMGRTYPTPESPIRTTLKRKSYLAGEMC